MQVRQLDREVARLETALDELTGERGVADVRRARQSSASAPAGDASPKEALPPHLLREERVLEAEATCPTCGSAMQPLGEDVTEQLARVAAVFKVIRTIRRKRVCSCGHHVSQPPMPGLPITRSIAHPSLLADILVSKYADHTPLYRQSQIAARDGVKLDPASMGRWGGQCEALCELAQHDGVHAHPGKPVSVYGVQRTACMAPLAVFATPTTCP
ncbi:transposase [Burkholderia lata]|uniref:Transposase n=1 Tax=Burkholderia lata (strain ATCC 17760 / DSM 23089 / LMG 22485 / NCIMB 9086 / R18194 / 383) TaxID=482957 RepID=A0A6P2P3S1_BURL3|nr:transposase [Burkholderia lata]VWC02400.1 transposase [Burkholderia lata]